MDRNGRSRTTAPSASPSPTITHLPIRKTVETRNSRTRFKTSEIEYYSNYHPIDGVKTPFQITRERNGIKIYQVFFDDCHYNTSVSDALFTKESLDQRWAQIPQKEKVRDKKETDHLKDKPGRRDSGNHQSAAFSQLISAIIRLRVVRPARRRGIIAGCQSSQKIATDTRHHGALRPQRQ